MSHINIVDILSLFEKDGINANEFERMAIFNDASMKEAAQKMQVALSKFIETGDYGDYLVVKGNFEYITKHLNSRDSYVTHNPDRSSRGY